MSSDSEVDIVVAASDSDSEIPQNQNQSIPAHAGVPAKYPTIPSSTQTSEQMLHTLLMQVVEDRDLCLVSWNRLESTVQ